MAEKRKLSVETAGDVCASSRNSIIMWYHLSPIANLSSNVEKANHVLQVSNNVVPKPGVTDGLFIVAGYGNTIHVVTPGKRRSLKCDRACVNFSISVLSRY